MKFTMTKIAAAVLVAASTGAMAVSEPVTAPSAFVMYDPAGDLMNTDATIGGFIDLAAGTWGVSSTKAFSGLKWTASGGTLFGPGTYTMSINGDGSDELVFDGVDVLAPLANGDGNYTFTVGAGQIGGNINFSWGGTSGIDVFQVWNITTDATGTQYTSTDFDGDGILGGALVDGPFPGFSPNFNINPGWLTPEDWTPPEEDVITPTIPEASTYTMMLVGLGLVGFMARRRKQSAI